MCGKIDISPWNPPPNYIYAWEKDGGSSYTNLVCGGTYYNCFNCGGGIGGINLSTNIMNTALYTPSLPTNVWETGPFTDIYILSPNSNTLRTCAFCEDYKPDFQIYDHSIILGPWFTRQESTRLSCAGSCNIDTSAPGGGCHTSTFCNPWLDFDIGLYGNASNIPSQPPAF